MKPAIGYIRVSTSRQATDGVSLDAQRERIEAYCRAMGLELMEECFSDPGESGTSLEHRPEANKAIAAAKSHGAVIVVYSLSRLFRNLIEGATAMKDLESAGVQVVSVTQSIDTSTAAGWLSLHFQLMLDDYEVRVTQERTRSSMRHKRKHGQRVSFKATFGHRLVATGRFKVDDETGENIEIMAQEEDPDEQIIIQRIVSMAKAAYNPSMIERVLKKEGVRGRSGTPIHRKTITKILERVNNGEDRQAEEKERARRPRSAAGQ